MKPPNPETIDAHAESLAADLTQEVMDSDSLAVSQPYVGQWNRLVSQTNWDKGRIISEWRTALVASDAPSTAYSDESWARQVGSVTSQHVGRLRRVYDRFSANQDSYHGLYWSHFLAAMDWDDAELWLEGAARSQWSVSELRSMRAEAMQAAGREPTQDEELIASEVDDGFTSLVTESEEDQRPNYDSDSASSTAQEGPDFGDDEHSESDPDRIRAADSEDDVSNIAPDLSNPFATLVELPPDVAEALEQFKLCIIRHRAANWSDFHQSKMLEVVDALRVFASR